MANDAMIYAFATPPDVLRRANGSDGEGGTLAKVYHAYLMKSDGLSLLLDKAQERLDAIVFSDPTLYPQTVGESTTVPLFSLIQESLFRATVGSVVSESIVSKEIATESLEEFKTFDERFPLLVAKLPLGLFPKAKEALESLTQKCKGRAYEQGRSPMMCDRDAVAEEKLRVTTVEAAVLSITMVWASTANTMPVEIQSRVISHGWYPHPGTSLVLTTTTM